MLAGMKFACLAFTVCVAFAADPDKPMFWSAAQNMDFDKKATAKLNGERHLGTERLMDSAFVAFRNAVDTVGIGNCVGRRRDDRRQAHRAG
jgi:hypothetical protein